MCAFSWNQACPSIFDLPKALLAHFLPIYFLWYFITYCSLLHLNVPFQHFPFRFIFRTSFNILTAHSWNMSLFPLWFTCAVMFSLSYCVGLKQDVAFFTAFTLLCENCTLYATCGHRPETQYSSTASVHTRSQWENLSIPCGQWLRTGGCSTWGACSAAASYAKSLLGQTEGEGDYQVFWQCVAYYWLFLIIRQPQYILY